ncbi:putative transposase [Vibrio nigripulchritudo ATCC 27043]|nr:putative transposase [Vibrio nigripulchritudo ATCC 27043]
MINTGGTISNCFYFGGIDLAKNHFSIHVVDSNGKVILHKFVTRPKLLTNIANMLLVVINHYIVYIF